MKKEDRKICLAGIKQQKCPYRKRHHDQNDTCNLKYGLCNYQAEVKL